MEFVTQHTTPWLLQLLQAGGEATQQGRAATQQRLSLRRGASAGVTDLIRLGWVPLVFDSLKDRRETTTDASGFPTATSDGVPAPSTLPQGLAQSAASSVSITFRVCDILRLLATDATRALLLLQSFDTFQHLVSLFRATAKNAAPHSDTILAASEALICLAANEAAQQSVDQQVLLSLYSALIVSRDAVSQRLALEALLGFVRVRTCILARLLSASPTVLDTDNSSHANSHQSRIELLASRAPKRTAL